MGSFFYPKKWSVTQGLVELIRYCSLDVNGRVYFALGSVYIRIKSVLSEGRSGGRAHTVSGCRCDNEM